MASTAVNLKFLGKSVSFLADYIYILEEKLGAIECESGNAEVQWKHIKECVLDTVSDLVGKVEKRARNPWITQEMISKMDE